MTPSRYTPGAATTGLFEKVSIFAPAFRATGSAPAVSVLSSGPTMILAPSLIARVAAAWPPSNVPPVS